MTYADVCRRMQNIALRLEAMLAKDLANKVLQTDTLAKEKKRGSRPSSSSSVASRLLQEGHLFLSHSLSLSRYLYLSLSDSLSLSLSLSLTHTHTHTHTHVYSKKKRGARGIWEQEELKDLRPLIPGGPSNTSADVSRR
jgi:hypothetical protein